MPKVISKDGTEIAYTKAGSGPALVLVDGALCWREAGVTPDFLPEAAKHFTVYAYDRRGRGESTDHPDFAIDREVEDLAAIVEATGEAPLVCGFSSGAVLIMYALADGLNARKAFLYEPPFAAEDTSIPAPPADAVAHLRSLLAKDDRPAMARYFMVDLVGMPAIFIPVMKYFMRKAWKSTQQAAPTLPYDVSFLERSGWKVPTDIAATITTPTVVSGGGKSPQKLKLAVEAAAAAIPSAELIMIPGATHMVKPVPLVKELVALQAR